MRRQQSPFSSLTHTLCLTFPTPQTNAVAGQMQLQRSFVIAQTNAIASHPLLSYIIDPLRHQQQIFTSVTLISTPTPTTFADITQSAINIPAFFTAPHPYKTPKISLNI